MTEASVGDFMFMGAQRTGGEIPAEFRSAVHAILNEFISIVRALAEEQGLPTHTVRSLRLGSGVLVVDKGSIFVAGEPHLGVGDLMEAYDPEETYTTEQVAEAMVSQQSFRDPFVVRIPRALLNESPETRASTLQAIVKEHIDVESRRVDRSSMMIQLAPIFGQASFVVDNKLAFVLMPFRDDLKEIYDLIIKPTVESVGLVCRRADDFNTNTAIMKDIWRAICEARVIIADLTSLNPNVMYELGIAHTVGKDSILIYQRSGGGDPRFPFDLAHIRRIEYANDASGGAKLREKLAAALDAALNPAALS